MGVRSRPDTSGPSDFTPFAFVVSGLALSWALLRVRFLDVTTVARKAIFENMSDGVVVLDAAGRVADYNRAAERILGQPAPSGLGRPVNEVWPNGREVLQRPDGALVGHWEVSLGEDTDRRIYEASASVLRTGKSSIAGQLIQLRDVTQRRREEERLRETARLASIGELAAGVAHEINNPLTVIVGSSEILMDKELEQPVEPLLERINLQAHRASRIVQNLLSFARRAEPQEQYLDIGVVLGQALDIKDHEFRAGNIRVSREWPEYLPRTMMDQHQMVQVMVNILTNAQQAMAEDKGGGDLRVRAARVGDRIRISVADDGPGITAEHITKIFDPFFTTKVVGVGTGLGLSTCYGIVRRHDGDIWAESVPGEGATFHVELPIRSPAVERPESM